VMLKSYAGHVAHCAFTSVTGHNERPHMAIRMGDKDVLIMFI